MIRQGNRPLAALVAVVLVAVLPACGGSDSESPSSPEAATEATTTAQDGSAERGASGAEGADPAGERTNRRQAGQTSQPDEAGNSHGRENVATPLEVSGGGSGQFRVEGGDNSIQEYGEESDESELREVAEIVHGFLVARTEGQWRIACSHLSRSNIEDLQRLAEQSPQPIGMDCETLLEAFTQPLSVSLKREITTVDAGSFRQEGDQGFLIYRGAGQTAYAMPMRKEGGAWKVAGLSATIVG